MKAKSRRRLLISSVAMLLVAMLALGTATFAWFTNSTTAYAKNAKVTVASPSGLVLKAVVHGATAPAANSTGWSSSFDMTSIAQKTAQPVSGNMAAADEPTFFAATVNTEKEVSDITSVAVDTEAHVNASNVVAVDIYGKLSETKTGIAGVKVNLASIANQATATVPGDVTRVAFYTTTTTGQTTTWSRKAIAHIGSDTNARAYNPLKAAGTNLTNVNADDNYVVPASNTTYVEATAISCPKNFATSTEVATVSNDSTQVTKLGTFYMWVEGQDAKCNDANKATVLGDTDNVQITFELGDDVNS